MALNPANLVELPNQLKGYKLLERLGRGGFGEVWKVEAPGGFLKAMKFVFGDLESSEEEGRPAEQELKALHRVKSIRHPYILSLERFDIIDGQLIIVMELADRNLWDRFRECRMLGLPGVPREELLRYLLEAAEALDLMNNHYQIQHMDIKPQNLFLVFDHVKVADFGLAKAIEGARATVTGGVTPVYAAPETFEGFVSRFSDQYSLAICYQELLTGKRPFNGANTKQLLLQHLRDLPDLSSLPEHDRDIIGRGLNKTPNERWPTCLEMMRHLAAAPNQAKVSMYETGALPLPKVDSNPNQTPISSGKSLGDISAANGQTSNSPDANQDSNFQNKITITPISASTSGVVSNLHTQMQTVARPTAMSASGLLHTQLPSLITPKLTTPKTANSSGAQVLTMVRKQVVETGRMGELGIAPPEKNGDGILLPSLIIGVGKTGLEIIRRLRTLLYNRFLKVDALPTIRFLYIDTDPESIAEASEGEEALTPQQILMTKLERPAHYLQRDSLPSVDQWLPSGNLYQLPKNATSTGNVRAYGRLALCDHYRHITQRIRQELEVFMSNDLLDKTARESGLGLRTNQPRVYITANLAGGTGSGMFLDLGFIIKHELHQVGYRNPETVAYLTSPPIDKQISRRSIANTFAALAELHHYSNGEEYKTRFENQDSPIIETHGPFTRTSIVELYKRKESKKSKERIGAISRAIYFELVTPVGRTTDHVRAMCPVDRFSGPVIQPFGLYRLIWPRTELLSTLTERFSQQLLRRWISRESAHLQEPIHWWLTDQWAKFNLEPESILDQFNTSICELMRSQPNQVFEAILMSLKQNVNGKVDAQSIVEVLDQLLKVVGKPEIEEGGKNTNIHEVLQKKAIELCAAVESQLAEVAVSFIEQPQYRLAGAEESLNQMIEKIKKTIEPFEQERKALNKDITTIYARMFPLIGGLKNGSFTTRRTTISQELMELLMAYPRKRYRVELVNAILSFYRLLLGNLPEYLREVSYCRSRLESLIPTQESKSHEGSVEMGEYILPSGCESLNHAAEQFIAALPPEDILGFDQSLQQLLSRKFKGLVNVCLKQSNSSEFLPVLMDSARDFLNERLEKADPAEAILRYRGSKDEIEKIFIKAYEQSQPLISLQGKKQPLESVIFSFPEGEAGKKVLDIALNADLGTELIPSSLPDGIALIREFSRLPITAIQQLGPIAQEAYEAMLIEGQNPHTRMDVTWLAPQAPSQ